MVKKSLVFLFVIFLFMAIAPFSKAYAIEIPTLVKSEVSSENDQATAVIEWSQADAKDYGYVVTRQKEGEEEMAVIELEPSSAGNTQLSKGGSLTDTTIKNNENYIYNIYPYNRNSEQLGDSFDLTSQTSFVKKALAADRPKLSVPIGPNSAKAAAGPGTPNVPSPALSCPAKQVPTELGCVSSFGQYFSTILDWLVPALSAVAVLMAVYAGILYMTSMGNAENLEKAKTLIFSVIFGIGLLFLLELVVRLLGIPT